MLASSLRNVPLGAAYPDPEVHNVREPRWHRAATSQHAGGEHAHFTMSYVNFDEMRAERAAQSRDGSMPRAAPHGKERQVTHLQAGLVIPRGTTRFVVDRIVQAEERGIDTVWSTSGGVSWDTLTAFAVAAARTERIVLGTSIVPTYPRHPFVMTSETLAIEDLAPGRVRLGVGGSHRPTIEGQFGIPMGTPLAHLREYVGILRGLLWEGSVDFEGDYYTVRGELPAGTAPPKTPLPISTLRPNAYRLAGEIADGAISWLNPIDYIVDIALPALEEGAMSAGGRARPSLRMCRWPFPPIVTLLVRPSARSSRCMGACRSTRRCSRWRDIRVDAEGRMPDGLVADWWCPVRQMRCVPDWRPSGNAASTSCWFRMFRSQKRRSSSKPYAPYWPGRWSGSVRVEREIRRTGKRSVRLFKPNSKDQEQTRLNAPGKAVIVAAIVVVTVLGSLSSGIAPLVRAEHWERRPRAKAALPCALPKRLQRGRRRSRWRVQFLIVRPRWPRKVPS